MYSPYGSGKTAELEGSAEKRKRDDQLFNATIMMVDDEPITMEVVQVFLEEAGYRHFELVDDPVSAMETIEQKRPDLLLLDLMMPEVSGFDILKAIRAHPKFKHLPVLILTSSSDQADKLSVLELGATDFLSKPVDPSELRLRVRNTLAAKAYMDQLAYYDPLTQLPNRHLFLEHLDCALGGAARAEEKIGVLSIELDQFDKLNDTLGIEQGDDVLRQVARRIQGVARCSDQLCHYDDQMSSSMALYHFKGGVFSLILQRLEFARDAAQVAMRIMKSFEESISTAQEEIFLTVSIGISTFPIDSTDGASLLRLATGARNHIKNKGGNTFQFSSQQIHDRYQRRLSLESRLRRALDHDEFILHYQPKVAVQTNEILGVEALLRWQPEGRGLIPPDKFIPLAEETGLIVPIGEWVLQHACEQLNEWRRAGKAPIGMAVNMSPLQFQDKEMPVVLRRVIDSSGVDTRLLTIEVTEGMLLEDIDHKIGLMNGMKELGLKLAIDDFGTGYSSISYLKKLPLDELKLDRSFFFDMSAENKSRALIAALIFLAHQLDLYTVAEGVETEEQLQILQKEGCDQYQGYLFSRPVPKDELAEKLPAI